MVRMFTDRLDSLITERHSLFRKAFLSSAFASECLGTMLPKLLFGYGLRCSEDSPSVGRRDNSGINSTRWKCSPSVENPPCKSLWCAAGLIEQVTQKLLKKLQ